MQHGQNEEKLKKLLADREAMTVESPFDGIVYYGKLVRGRTGDAAALAEAVSPPRPAAGQPSFDDRGPAAADVHPHDCPGGPVARSAAGAAGTAVPTGYPDLDLPAQIDTVSDIPISPGNFDGRLTVRVEGQDQVVAARHDLQGEAGPVPARQTPFVCRRRRVVTDELDEHKQSVQVLEKDGKIVTRPVTVGRKTDQKVEILSGVAEGEKVVMEPEREQK